MRLVFLLEEKSMKELLDGLLPRILPPGVEFMTIPHNGKSDLQKSIPGKLNGWQYPGDRFVIVHEQDSNDCIQLKEDLLTLCGKHRPNVLVRIACRELESWYFGDLTAVSKAYGRAPADQGSPDDLPIYGYRKQHIRELSSFRGWGPKVVSVMSRNTP